LRAPYELLWIPYTLLRYCFPTSLPRISTRESDERSTEEQLFTLPEYWKAEHTPEILTAQVLRYLRGDIDEQAAELLKGITEDTAAQAEKQTAELTGRMAEDLAAVKDEIAQFKAAVLEMHLETMGKVSEREHARTQLSGTVDSFVQPAPSPLPSPLPPPSPSAQPSPLAVPTATAPRLSDAIVMRLRQRARLIKKRRSISPDDSSTDPT